MSRAFINEDKQTDTPVVPQRAHLPAETINYVTPVGLEMLMDEKQQLLDEFKAVNEGDRHDKVTLIRVINIKLQRLEERIVTARIIENESEPHDEVRFGSTVLLQIGTSKNSRRLQIVGVDEADLKLNKIAFISPLANQLMNKKVGDRVVLPDTGNSFKILGIE